jgi:hypothetical protein
MSQPAIADKGLSSAGSGQMNETMFCVILIKSWVLGFMHVNSQIISQLQLCQLVD